MKQNNLSENLNQWDKISRYSQWMFNSYKEYIGKRVLDIGAGIGNMTKFYIDEADLVVTADIFEDQINIMKQRFINKKNFRAILFDILNDDNIEDLKKDKFDTIILINVLEHLVDDKKAIERLKELITDDGHIIILVPALQSLYCFMDKNVSHHRRYNRGVLENLAKFYDLKVIENKYFNFFGIFPYYFKGKFSRNKHKGGSFSTDLNENNSKIYNIASEILEPLEKIIKPCIGISEIIVLQK